MKKLIFLLLFSFSCVFAIECATVIKVYDGDTITVKMLNSGDKYKVRLIGIDTPELKDNKHGKKSPYASLCKKYLSDLILNKDIELECDVQRFDRYNRLLAYVYYKGEMVNLKMLKEGYAKLYTVPPNVKYVERFKDAQAEAHNERRGLWRYEK